LILWHALLAAPLHLTRCRKTFFTVDYFLASPMTRTLALEGRPPLSVQALSIMLVTKK
jgi:hypothetical protein